MRERSARDDRGRRRRLRRGRAAVAVCTASEPSSLSTDNAGDVLLCRCRSRQSAASRAAQGLRVHQQRGVPLVIQRTGRAEVRRSVLSSRSAKLEPQHVPLVAERAVGAHRQPPLSSPTRFSAGTRTSVEEDLVEVQVVGAADRPERPARDARQIGRDQQHADAPVLGRIRVGAHEGQQHVRVVRARRPHLLPVDDEVVAVEDRAGAQAGQVRSRPRARSCPATR